MSTEPNRKKLFPRIILCFLISWFVLGCSVQENRQAGWIRIGIESNPANLDPRMVMDAVSSSVTGLIYNGLFKLDNNSRFVPDLVLSWEHPDPLTYKVSLRPGLLFHDLSPLTARDVKYTYDSILSPELKSPKAGALADLKKVTVSSADTVVFKLKSPNAAFLGNLCIGIVPAASQGKSGLPAGSGPFRFSSHEPDREVRLEAFGQYFKGAPKLAGVIFKIVPENMMRVLKLEQKELDLIQNPIFPEMLGRLDKNPSLTVMMNPGTTFKYLGFNYKDRYLSKKAVRKAIAFAIDRESIIKHILKGLAQVADSLLPAGHWAYAADLPKISYDPALSKKLLDEAGFPDPDGEGPRTRFRLVYKTSQNQESRLEAEVIQSQLQRIGIEIKIESYEWGTFFSDIKQGDFQLYSLKWVGITDPDIFFYIFHSESVPPKGANRGHYINRELDRLLVQGRTASGPEKRRDIYARVQHILAQEMPYVNLWHQTNLAVMQKRVKGFEPSPNGDLGSLWKVSLSE